MTKKNLQDTGVGHAIEMVYDFCPAQVSSMLVHVSRMRKAVIRIMIMMSESDSDSQSAILESDSESDSD